ncbi:VanZ family protein [Desulfuromusa kysingii]|nr:VanZ family protein [Desulfuromusa kysingii]
MKLLHRKRQYLLSLLALLAAVFLFVGGPGPDSLRSFRFIWGMGHLFCFALWAYLYVCWRTPLSFKRSLLEIFLFATLFGALSELIQSQIGREAAWSDLGNDIVGALAGLCFFAESRKTIAKWQLKALQIPLLLLVLWILLPVGKVIVDDLISWRQFPLLSGFETPLEKTRWGTGARHEISQSVAFSGRSSLRIKLTTQRYSGLGLKDFPHDWRGYRTISLQVFNPDEEKLTLHFRIHDQQHRQYQNAYSDRFNTSFAINPGWNHLQVPLETVAHAPKDRLMDMGHIAGMGLFVGKLSRPRTIYLDEVRLLP